MKFSIGDIVLLKHTGEEGRVVSLINKEMVEVEVKGTHFPVFLDEIDHPYLKWFTEKNQSKQKAKQYAEDLAVEKSGSKMIQGVASGFHLSFLPVFKFDDFEDVVEKFKVHFINQTANQLVIQYECNIASGSLFAHKTIIQPFTHFYLHDIPFEEMNLNPRFSWILNKDDEAGEISLSDTLRIKPKKLFEYISKLQKENKPMFYIKMADSFPEQIFQKEQKIVKEVKDPIADIVQAINQQRKPRYRSEVDLHIEMLIDDIRGLSNFEMLMIQLDAFEVAINEAINSGQQSLVVIHGVGKGRLKEDIHNLLRANMYVDFFLSEWNPKYGYGATEIFFKQ